MPRNAVEQQARMYWTIMRQYTLLRRAHFAFPDVASEVADELEVLAEYTDSRHLRHLCIANLNELRPEPVMGEMCPA